jgi:hypothetical protein
VPQHERQWKEGRHATSGCHFVCYRAHQIAASALQRVASSLGFSVSHATAIPSSKKHADLMIYILFDDVQATAIDVSVRNPFMVAQGVEIRPMMHLEAAEKSMHANLGRGFAPFVVSSTGLFASDAMKVINALAKRYALLHDLPVHTAKRLKKKKNNNNN